MLSAAMLLGWLGDRHDRAGYRDAAGAIDNAVNALLAEPAPHSRDLGVRADRRDGDLALRAVGLGRGPAVNVRETTAGEIGIAHVACRNSNTFSEGPSYALTAALTACEVGDRAVDPAGRVVKTRAVISGGAANMERSLWARDADLIETAVAPLGRAHGRAGQR